MKKLILSLFILILLAVIGVLFVLPYGLGYVAKDKYAQIIEVLAKSNTLPVTLVSYQRGWFSSEAILKVDMPADLATQPAEALMIKQHIEHGPLFSLPLNTGEKQVAFGQMLITTHIHSAWGNAEVISRIKLNGTLVGNITAAQLRYTSTQSAQQVVELKNLTGTFKLSADLKRLLADVSIPQANITLDQFTQQANQIKFAYDLKKSDSGLFLGKRSLKVDTITWNADFIPNKAVKLQGLKIEGCDQEQNHQLNSEIDAELKYLNINNASYGPQQLVLAINHIDIPAFLVFRKELKNLHQLQISPQEMLARYQQSLVALLSKGLELQVKKLQMVTPWGSPSMVMNFAMPAVTTNNMQGLIGGMNVVAEINVPAPFLVRLLEQLYQNTPATSDITAPAVAALNPSQIAQQKITEWVNKRWLLPKGNGYQSMIMYQNRQATINDQPLEVSPAEPETATTTTPILLDDKMS